MYSQPTGATLNSSQTETLDGKKRMITIVRKTENLMKSQPKPSEAAELETFREENKYLKTRNTDLEHERNEFETKCNDACRAFNKKSDELSQAQKMIDVQSAENARLHDVIDSSAAENKKHREIIAKLSAQLKTKTSDLEKSQDQLSKTKDEKMEAAAAVAAARKKLTQSNQEVSRLKSKNLATPLWCLVMVLVLIFFALLVPDAAKADLYRFLV